MNVLFAFLFMIIGLVVGIVAMFIRDTYYIHEIIKDSDECIHRIHENDMRQMKRMAAVINEYQMRDLSERLGAKIIRATPIPNTDWVELDFSNLGSFDNIDFPNKRKGDGKNGND